MTPEQLDEIEKLAADGAFKAAGYYALPLVKVVREAREIIDHYERKDGPMFQAHLAEAKALMERDEARTELEHAVAEGGALYEAKVAQSEAEQERDDARALLAALKEEHRPADELRSQLLAEIEAHAETKAKVASLTDWYQQRFNALRAWVKKEVEPFSTAVATGYWNIVANGSPSPHESADWAGTLHAAKVGAHVAGVRADNAERREAHLKTELDEARAEVERLRGIVEVNDRRLAAVWDEARAEVEMLREAVRWVHALAGAWGHSRPDAIVALAEIHKITKGMVE